jgi:hypothetical protein
MTPPQPAIARESLIAGPSARRQAEDKALASQVHADASGAGTRGWYELEVER